MDVCPHCYSLHFLLLNCAESVWTLPWDTLSHTHTHTGTLICWGKKLSTHTCSLTCAHKHTWKHGSFETGREIRAVCLFVVSRGKRAEWSVEMTEFWTWTAPQAHWCNLLTSPCKIRGIWSPLFKHPPLASSTYSAGLILNPPPRPPPLPLHLQSSRLMKEEWKWMRKVQSVI